VTKGRLGAAGAATCGFGNFTGLSDISFFWDVIVLVFVFSFAWYALIAHLLLLHAAHNAIALLQVLALLLPLDPDRCIHLGQREFVSSCWSGRDGLVHVVDEVLPGAGGRLSGE